MMSLPAVMRTCVVLMLLSLATPGAFAQVRPVAEWKGYAGAGAIAFPKYTGGRGSETVPIPLMMFEYKETVYVDLLRAGVRLWSDTDRKIALGLAMEPRFGFRAADGVRLGGMSTRRTSVELGPSVEWETPVASFNLAWFGDVNNTSRGSSLRASVYRQFIDSAHWDVGGYVGIDRGSAKVADYYFGVRADEVTIARGSYQPGATTHLNVGATAAHRFTRSYALILGAQTTRLGGAAAASPIVQTRNATIGYIGLAWRL